MRVSSVCPVVSVSSSPSSSACSPSVRPIVRPVVARNQSVRPVVSRRRRRRSLSRRRRPSSVRPSLPHPTATVPPVDIETDGAIEARIAKLRDNDGGIAARIAALRGSDRRHVCQYLIHWYSGTSKSVLPFCLLVSAKEKFDN